MLIVWGSFKWCIRLSKDKKNPQKIAKLKPYINKYNWKNIKFLLDKEDWKKFEQNNKEIVLNMLFVPHNKKEIRPPYISKYNHKHKKQVILLMITDDGKRWHYLAVRSLHCLEEYHQVIMEI